MACVVLCTFDGISTTTAKTNWLPSRRYCMETSRLSLRMFQLCYPTNELLILLLQRSVSRRSAPSCHARRASAAPSNFFAHILVKSSSNVCNAVDFQATCRSVRAIACCPPVIPSLLSRPLAPIAEPRHLNCNVCSQLSSTHLFA